MPLDSMVMAQAKGLDTEVNTREPPDVGMSRLALVNQMMDEFRAAKAFHAPALDRMRDAMDFAYKWGRGAQWHGQLPKNDPRYVANIVQRMIANRVARLYAKNPTFTATRKPKMDFRVWNGSPGMLEAAQQSLQQSFAMRAPPPVWALLLLEDVREGMMRREMLDRVATTLQMVFQHYVKESRPDFKKRMKQLVRRISTCGIGYIKVGYQRKYGPRNEIDARIADTKDRLARIEAVDAALRDQQIDDMAPEVEALRLELQELEKEQPPLLREGLVFDFPPATSLIVDPDCSSIVEDFADANWIAEEHLLTPRQIEEKYGVDVRQSYAQHVQLTGKWDGELGAVASARATDSGGLARWSAGLSRDAVALVVHRYDKASGLIYKMCDGWPDFLEEPRAPDVRVEGFFPYIPIAYNPVEHPDEIYPMSDVILVTDQQREINRQQQALRQHRIASRPIYVTPSGTFPDADQNRIADAKEHEVVELDGLKEGEKVGDKIQPLAVTKIDPNVYQTGGVFQDMQRITGDQEADYGTTTGSSATEVAEAASSRVSGLESAAGDMDDGLTALSRMGAQVLLMNLTRDTAMRIAGVGGVWPEYTIEQIVDEIDLVCEAGSSGVPNQARKVNTLKNLGPMMMQLPNIAPDYIAREFLRALGSEIDLEQALLMGQPSIMAMNAQARTQGALPMPGGEPAGSSVPEEQGAAGGDNMQHPPMPAGSQENLSPAPMGGGFGEPLNGSGN